MPKETEKKVSCQHIYVPFKTVKNTNRYQVSLSIVKISGKKTGTTPGCEANTTNKQVFVFKCLIWPYGHGLEDTDPLWILQNKSIYQSPLEPF